MKLDRLNQGSDTINQRPDTVCLISLLPCLKSNRLYQMSDLLNQEPDPIYLISPPPWLRSNRPCLVSPLPCLKSNRVHQMSDLLNHELDVVYLRDDSSSQRLVYQAYLRRMGDFAYSNTCFTLAAICNYIYSNVSGNFL